MDPKNLEPSDFSMSVDWDQLFTIAFTQDSSASGSAEPNTEYLPDHSRSLLRTDPLVNTSVTFDNLDSYILEDHVNDEHSFGYHSDSDFTTT
jgi:hypothetical protein